jgi:hypothetical protein
MNKLPVLADFYYDKIGSFRTGNPFTIAFCYTSPRFHRLESFVVKGGANDVQTYLRDQLGFPMLVHLTFWRHGRGRRLGAQFYNFKQWSNIGDQPYVIPENRRIHKNFPIAKAYYRNFNVHFGGRIWMRVRRLPRKWLPEYNEMLEYRYPVGQIHS